jgi:hypothetical protein
MKTFYLILALALFLPEECGYYHDGGDTGASDPSQLILGQWQEIARGNDTFPELTPVSLTIEFLTDGMYRGPLGFHHGRDDGEASYYRIESDSLHLYRNGNSNTYIYRYLFTGKNQLRMEYVRGPITYSLATPTFHIYERLK